MPGADYVDSALRNEDDLTRPLQQYVTEVAWGTVWNRPRLDRRPRSPLTLAMLTALNRPHELRLHLRCALRSAVTREETRDPFLHAAGCCGAPAAVDAFRTAREVLDAPGG